MKNHNFLLIKTTLKILTAVSGFVAVYLLFDNLLIGLSFGCLYLMIYYVPVALKYYRNRSDIIIKGFNFNMPFLYTGLGVIMAYFTLKSYNELSYILILPFLFIGIDKGLNVITFDFENGVIIGLINNKRHEMSKLTVEYLTNNISEQIKITDKNDSIMLDKSTFGDRKWKKLTENINKMKI
jgi:hypothetical protein